MRILGRILTSIGELAWYAAAAAIIAALIYLAEGEKITKEGGLPLARIIGMYAIVALVSGIVLGLLRPLARGTWSTLCISIPVAFPSALTIIWLANDRQFRRFSMVDISIALGIAAFLGPFATTYVRVRDEAGRAKSDVGE